MEIIEAGNVLNSNRSGELIPYLESVVPRARDESLTVGRDLEAVDARLVTVIPALTQMNCGEKNNDRRKKGW